MDTRMTFEIIWYAGGDGIRPIGKDLVKRHDLTSAITAACNMLKANKGSHGGYAQGFYVRRLRGA